MASRKSRGGDLGIPAHDGDYLMEALFEVGPASNNGMGPVPVEWSTLAPYGVLAGLHRWELAALHRMSSAYLKGFEAGKDPFSKPPTDWPDEELP